jgi:hypothetical protein
MKKGKTQRGFDFCEFKDRNGNECSIQMSSIATENCIWFGIDEPKLTVFENEDMGKYIETTLPKNWMVEGRMHLSQKQVKEILPILQKFAETGEI